MPKVIVSTDGVVIREVSLQKERTSLGRRPYNDIVIDHLVVSGEHAAFLMKGNEVFLEDLNSTNGTFINGQAVKSQRLQSEDTVEIGKFQIKYINQPETEALEQAASFESSQFDQPLTVAPPSEFSPSKFLGPAALIRVLSGASTGREVPLTKVVTTVGKPGVAVASISRRRHGYVVAQVDGADRLLLNGAPVGDAPVALNSGDHIELADTRLQFILV